MATRKKSTGSAASRRTAAASTAAAPGGTAELRVNVTIGDEKTEYRVQEVGDGGAWNVTAAHDPNGEFILPENAPDADAAIEAFSKLFDKDKVTVSGTGDCYAIVNGDGKVLAVEKDRDAASRKAEQLAKEGGDVPASTGTVYPATSAVQEMFGAVGTEGTRVHIIGGVVTLAR